MGLKKRAFYILLLAAISLYACRNEKGINSKFTEQPEQQESGAEEVDVVYDMLNKPILATDATTLFCNISEEEIFKFAAEQQDSFEETINKDSLFPADLIVMIEKVLFNSCNYFPGSLEMSDNIETNYYELRRTLGAEEFEVMSLEDLQQMFPEKYKKGGEYKNVYEAYMFITGDKHCIAMFRADILPDENNFIIVSKSGGTDGVAFVRLKKWKNGEFTTICEFQKQTSGEGRVIKYEDSHYYIYLQVNKELAVFDSIRLHRLGKHADTENILIKYLPDQYAWKNVYIAGASYDEKVDEYIESMKGDIVFNVSLKKEVGHEFNTIYGDEVTDSNSPLVDNDEEYQMIDFTNMGIPIYIKYVHFGGSMNFIPQLTAKFYMYNHQTDSMLELEDLELGLAVSRSELMQMWFKKIEDKVFTLRLYHISDFNYMLDTILVEEDQVTTIRTDILSPKREIVLTEGEVARFSW